jgi:hypothetical protein
MKRNLAVVVLIVGVAAMFVYEHTRAHVTEAPAAGGASEVHRVGSVAEPALAEERPAPRERLSARAAEEWQGMRIDLDAQPLCEASERCGLATACVAGHCGACRGDSDCAGGEVCVLEHCVRAALVACRGRADCTGGALCVLSGISADARGNGDMRAYCQGKTVDAVQDRATYERNQQQRTGIPAPPRAVTPQKLLDEL